MQPIFKVGDRVFWDKKGWGEIKRINEDEAAIYPITAIFNGISFLFTIEGKFHSDDLVPSLSFSWYTYAGFSQTRPKPDLKPGDLIWVCGNYTDWMYRRFSHWSENGVLTTSQLYDLPLIECPNWSIECPVKSSPPQPPLAT